MVRFTKKKDNNLTYDGKPVTILTFKSEEGEPDMTIWDDMVKIISDYAKEISKRGVKGMLQIKVHDPVVGWLTMNEYQDIEVLKNSVNIEMMILDHDENFYNEYLIHIKDKYRKFQIHLVQERDSNKNFGKDKYNDFLYNCLMKIAEKETKKAFPTPKSLKKFLGISRVAMIKIEQILLIEQELKLELLEKLLTLI